MMSKLTDEQYRQLKQIDKFCSPSECIDAFLALGKVQDKSNIVLIGRRMRPLGKQNNVLFLLIALTHPDYLPEDLRAIAQQLSIANEEALTLAAALGNLHYLKYLATQVPSTQWPKLKMYRLAAANGHLDTLKYLDQPQDLAQMIRSGGYKAIRYAAKNARKGLDILNYHAGQLPDRFQRMIIDMGVWNFMHFANLFLGELEQMIRDRGSFLYGNFVAAAERGHLDILKYLAEQLPNELGLMINFNHYKAFQGAASNGHLAILKYLAEQLPDSLDLMIRFDDYKAFQGAASNGHLAIIKYLAEQLPDELARMSEGIFLSRRQCSSFQIAAAHGHLDILKYLAEQLPGELMAMIKGALISAAEEGQLQTIKYLAQLWPDELAKKIQYGFFSAAEKGQLQTIKYLAQQWPDKITTILLGEPSIYAVAAKSGQIEILEYLAEQWPDKLAQMIKCNNYLAFRYAAWSDRTVQYLLRFPELFSYAERHVAEYGTKYVQPFITEWLSILQKRDRNEYPDVVYCQEEAQLCFYMLRHLIRTSSDPHAPKIADKVSQLLSILVVQNMLHLPITNEHKHNELLRLALTANKPLWAGWLMSFEGVSAKAMADGYYQDEARGHAINLQAIANDDESSLCGLNRAEQEFVNTLNELYPITNQEQQWQAMYGDLKAYYLKNPAIIVITRKGAQNTIHLPASWDEWMRLRTDKKFTNAECQQANEAYYQHAAHTSLRFFMAPNPWIKSSSSYVLSVDGGHHAWWRGLESLYIQTWRAAADPKAVGCDGYTVADRIAEYLRSIALIARAHNWDGTCNVISNGKSVQHYFDDLKLDSPSCHSGMLKRLVASVKGHSLLSGDMEGYVEEYIREQVYESMSNKLASWSTEQLEALDLGIKFMQISGNLDDELIKLTKTTNISLNEVTAWEQGLWNPTKTQELFKQKTASLRLNKNHFVEGLAQYNLLSLMQKTLANRTDGSSLCLKEKSAITKQHLTQEHVESKKPLWIHLLYQQPPELFQDKVKITTWVGLLGTLEEEEQGDLLNYLFEFQPKFFQQLMNQNEAPKALKQLLKETQDSHLCSFESDHSRFLKLCNETMSHLLRFIKKVDSEILKKENEYYSLAKIREVLTKGLVQVNYTLTIDHKDLIQKLNESRFLDNKVDIQFVLPIASKSLYEALPSNPLCDGKEKFIIRAQRVEVFAAETAARENLFAVEVARRGCITKELVARNTDEKMTLILKRLDEHHKRLEKEYPAHNIVNVSKQLIEQLQKNKEAYQAAPLENERFYKSCTEAINKAKIEFATHRSHPLIQAIHRLLHWFSMLFNNERNRQYKAKAKFFEIKPSVLLTKSAELLFDVAEDLQEQPLIP